MLLPRRVLPAAPLSSAVDAALRSAAVPDCGGMAGGGWPRWADAAVEASGVLAPPLEPERRQRRSSSCCAAICLDGEVSGRRTGLATSGVNHAP